MKKMEVLVLAGVVTLLAGVSLSWWRERQRFPGTPLEQAASKGDTATVEKLLKSGASVNARPAHRPPALVAAVQKGQTETVRVLLQHGADRQSRDTALAVAVRQCDLPTVQLLLSGGADGKSLLKPDESGRSPFVQMKDQVGAGPSPCADVLKALESSGISDKPRTMRKR